MHVFLHTYDVRANTIRNVCTYIHTFIRTHESMYASKFV